MKSIAINSKRNQYETFVDDDVFNEVCDIRWHLSGNGYVMAREGGGKRKTTLLHRIVMGSPEGLKVDHIDGNRLNNCRSNLRICSTSENGWNHRKYRKVGRTSEYSGIGYDRTNGKWQASLSANGENIQLGRYEKEQQAALAYDVGSCLKFGPFARPNFLTAPHTQASPMRRSEIRLIAKIVVGIASGIPKLCPWSATE